jgi:hypothetical protein
MDTWIYGFTIYGYMDIWVGSGTRVRAEVLAEIATNQCAWPPHAQPDPAIVHFWVSQSVLQRIMYFCQDSGFTMWTRIQSTSSPIKTHVLSGKRFSEISFLKSVLMVFIGKHFISYLHMLANDKIMQQFFALLLKLSLVMQGSPMNTGKQR